MAEQDPPEGPAPNRGRLEHADLPLVPHQRTAPDDRGEPVDPSATP
ncbi:MAG TPA: hypothetical protein VGC57_00315 [Cellulomonas sp.]